MAKRYTALRVIGTIYKVLGVITAVLTILSILGICATSIFGGAAMDSFIRNYYADSYSSGLIGGVLGGIIISLFGVIFGGGLAVTLYAIGEGVDLLIALEENSRATVALLQKQVGQ